MRSPRALILTFLALVIAASVDALPGDRKTLVVRGRTIDGEGFPVAKVRVWVDGVRKASALSDADGQFSLTFPIGTPDDLRRNGLRLAVRAEHRGWRFAIPGGDPALALEIGLEPGAAGTAQCVARSNDEGFAASVARAVALDGEAVGLMAINFLGVKGELTGDEPWPNLTKTARAALSFTVAAPSTAVAETKTSAPPKAVGTESGAGSQPSAVAGAAASGASSPATSAASQKEVAKTSSPAIEPKAAGPSEAERELAEVHASTARESLAAANRAATRAARNEARVRQQAKKALERAAGHADPAPGASPRVLARATSPLPGPGDSVAVGATRFLAPDSVASAWRSPTAGPARDSIRRVFPAPGQIGSRSRAAPLVIQAMRRLAATASDSCECRIAGTVEVQSDKPLDKPEKIEVSLVWYPQVRDTVELFMGSPRPFELGPARCGPQRLRLKILSGGRFDVQSREALAGFRCDGDRVVEQRVVLVPR